MTGTKGSYRPRQTARSRNGIHQIGKECRNREKRPRMVVGQTARWPRTFFSRAAAGFGVYFAAGSVAGGV